MRGPITPAIAFARVIRSEHGDTRFAMGIDRTSIRGACADKGL